MREKYFKWMVSITKSEDKYGRLLEYLDSCDFTYTIKMDENRYQDGIDLRYRFGDDVGVSKADIDLALGDRGCSVLEMMLALCIRCEEHILDDPEYGDRTSVWFWEMIKNMGLLGFTDARFREPAVKKAVDRMLRREYEPNGKGGLFTVENKKDLRTVEIWYQAMWHFTDILLPLYI